MDQRRLRKIIERAKDEGWVDLDLRAQNLTKLPSEIGQLTRLKVLNMTGNSLKELPPEIGQLTRLQWLYLDNNALSVLPPEIKDLSSLTHLDLWSNPLPIPPEILGNRANPRAIFDYYFTHLAQPTRPLNEIKLLLVGSGRVGKTSLANRLIDGTFNSSEPITEGIQVRRWDLPVAINEVRVNVWDFGGQEIMHATHQFFLTIRSIYVIVIDAGAGEQQARLRYWLNMAATYGGGSPVIVVVNKIDQHHLKLNQANWQEEFPNIVAFVETSSKTGVGIETLRQTLATVIGDLPHVRDLLPESWFAVKRTLEDLPDATISYSEYQGMCRKEGIQDKKDHTTLIDFLHALGAVLHFRYHPVLVQAGVLKPDWVTGAAYKLLNADMIKERGGVLYFDDLPGLLEADIYPEKYYPYILQLMEQFELAFPIGDGTYLIPDLLDPQTPPLDWDEQENLRFWLDYAFLPSSILSRFITRFYRLLEPGHAWHGGAVVAADGCRARVHADEAANRITIDVAGPQHLRRDFLAQIRGGIRAVQPDIRVTERVPIPGYPDVTVSYEHLLKLNVRDVREHWVEGADEPIDVRLLLDGIASPEQQRKDGDMYINFRDVSGKVNISGRDANIDADSDR